MPWILPLIAALFWFGSYRPSAALPPLWIQRTFYNLGQGHALIDFGPIVAGVAAWMGSRDGRRAVSDLMTATARPRWAAQIADLREPGGRHHQRQPAGAPPLPRRWHPARRLRR